MYSELKNRALSLRKLAIQKGMPKWALCHADWYIDHAIHTRSLPECNQSSSNRLFDRAKQELLVATGCYESFLNERFTKYKLPNLTKELSK
jgi:hypothetical protein